MIQRVPQARHGWRDYALLLALACCWSSTYPLTKIGLGSIPPITFISARSLTAALFLLIVLRLRGIRMPTDAVAWKLFAVQQTINSTIPFLMITWAQQYVPAASTVVLASTTPIFAFLITWAVLALLSILGWGATKVFPAGAARDVLTFISFDARLAPFPGGEVPLGLQLASVLELPREDFPLLVVEHRPHAPLALLLGERVEASLRLLDLHHAVREQLGRRVDGRETATDDHGR